MFSGVFRSLYADYLFRNRLDQLLDLSNRLAVFTDYMPWREFSESVKAVFSFLSR